MFKLVAPFEPTGDQPAAIEQLVRGLKAGQRFHTLLGVTGSGKTFTVASTIAQLNRPTLVVSPNKVLAAQLFQEFRSFFPENAVHFFVSYYDYYQPEAYLPAIDTYIDKDARINELLDQLRHAAVQGALTRRDCIIVCSVSCLYGIGDPAEYERTWLKLSVGERIRERELRRSLEVLQYQRARGAELKAGTFRFAPPMIEIALPDASALFILELEGSARGTRGATVVNIRRVPISRRLDGTLVPQLEQALPQNEATIIPAKLYVTPQDKLALAIENIRREIHEHYWTLLQAGKVIEAERLRHRALLDLELLERNGYCSGIENYARHLSFRQSGEPPFTLLDYLPDDTLVVVDESHLTLPQVRAMARGDRQRKSTLVEHGWRLPSAIDNRPLTFEEFFGKVKQGIFVSATPSKFERDLSQQVVEQLIRPTFIPDPEVEIRKPYNQVPDLLRELRAVIAAGERALVLTLTKRSSENLTEFLLANGIRARYLHADTKTLKRAEIIRSLRLGEVDVLVGINLLREGLDLPEVSLVLILDADREGFIRNETTLIQAIGRAARHPRARAILYADTITKSITRALQETDRRRSIQLAHNIRHSLTPVAIVRAIHATPLEALGRATAEFDKPATREDLMEFLETERAELGH